ncbi:MAG TPA: hypothetical protein VHY08_18710 [Bacillota bacterium]|nr:hypothetical protein [Bacillota bacterium]
MHLFKKDTFVKDIFWLLLVGIIGSAILAAGLALTTDQYFAKAVTGIIGDFGECDLLFQTREELKGAMVRQVQQVISDRFPGATLKEGMSLVGKASYFLTLPQKYKTKAIYNSLNHYFNNLPGNGGYSVMTEPRFDITSVPGGVFDLLSREVEKIPGVSFTFNDGGSIGVILKRPQDQAEVIRRVKRLLNQYQVLDIRLATHGSTEEIVELGKKVSQSLLALPGINYARDISMAKGTGDYQYLVNTLAEVKKFLLAYAAEVKVNPNSGQQVEIGDLLVLNGQNPVPLKPGGVLEPLQVVVKVTAKDPGGIRGLIIQGDASYLSDNQIYRLLPGDKIGIRVGTIEVSSRKSQLMYAMDQGVKLLDQINLAINDFNNTTGGADLTVTGIETIYQKLIRIGQALKSMETNLTGLNGKANQANLTRMVLLLDGISNDLDYLAKTFGRVQILENRFDQALEGIKGAQLLMGIPMMQNSIGKSTEIYDKLQVLNGQITTVEKSLRERVQKLDDFINRFNPLVAVLLSWRDKAREFSGEINKYGTVFTPGSANYEKLTGLIQSTDRLISNLTGFNLAEAKSGFNIVTDHLFGSDKIDLAALSAEVKRMRDSLPKLLDEEIGRSVNLIDKYVGGESVPGESIQIFTSSRIKRGVADMVIKETVHSGQISTFSLPAGTIQPDLRGELFKILAEVRSTIAALMVLILWILTFTFDHSLIISMMKCMKYSFLPAKASLGSPFLEWGYQVMLRIFSPANLYAAGSGGILLSITSLLAGARIPYLNFWILGLIGAILGVLVSMIAERINPINKEEVLAGVSLGLPFKTIMREIVIPAGRPGILNCLNRWKLVMK